MLMFIYNEIMMYTQCKRVLINICLAGEIEAKYNRQIINVKLTSGQKDAGCNNGEHQDGVHDG